jgi:hypothetical protein
MFTTDFPTAPLASGPRGAGGGTVEKSRPRLTHRNQDTPLKIAPDEFLDFEFGAPILYAEVLGI